MVLSSERLFRDFLTLFRGFLFMFGLCFPET